jgi:hypothetical protein
MVMILLLKILQLMILIFSILREEDYLDITLLVLSNEEIISIPESVGSLEKHSFFQSSIIKIK